MDASASSGLYWPDWLTAVVAVVALAQVWVIALWQKFFRRGKLEIHESRLIEIGYSNFGPTIRLLGTLRALHREAFVTRMVIDVVRKLDSARMSFDWRARCSTSFTSGQPEQTTMQVACSFLIPANSSQSYDLLFASEDFEARHITRFQAWIKDWHQRASNLPPDGADTKQSLDEAFDAFFRERQTTEFYMQLERDFIWSGGEYTLQLKVECADGMESSKSWQVTLPDEDARQLRLNIIGAMRGACGLDGYYHRAYRRYETAATLADK